MTETATLMDCPSPGCGSLAEGLVRRVSSATVIRREEPLAKRTTLRVGGPAEVYVEPASEAELAEVVRFVAERGVSLFVLGRGSNLLVRDGGIRGVVIALAHPAFSAVEVVGERIRCGAGAKLKQVAVEAKRAGLSGVEFLEGIPGSVGGALRMNAGAMGAWSFEVVESIRLMDYAGRILEKSVAEVPTEYRVCPMLKKPYCARRRVPMPAGDAGSSRATHERVQREALGLATGGFERGVLLQESGDDSGRPLDSGVGTQRLSHRWGHGFAGARQLHCQRRQRHGEGCFGFDRLDSGTRENRTWDRVADRGGNCG